MKIYIASDHAGFELKEVLKKYLPELGLGYEVVDLGAFTLNPEDDYPDFVMPLAQEVAKNPDTFGIVIGGSGQGEAMCANRVHGIRAAVFYGPRVPVSAVDVNGAESSDQFEILKLEREHNNANVISIGTRFVDADEAKFAVELFLKTEFSKDERHIRRLSKF